MFKLSSSLIKKETCPRCGRRNHLQLYIDTLTGEVLPLPYGKCDNEIKCGYWVKPTRGLSFSGFHTGKKVAVEVLPKESETAGEKYAVTAHRATTAITSEDWFTEVRAYGKGADGVITHYNLQSLVQRLNTTNSERKDLAPAILKGVYSGGITGENCTKSAPFLLFDIDVSEKENTELYDLEKNAKVFAAIKDIAVLLWRSNSGRGIAGIFYVPDLQHFCNDTRAAHLVASKAIYDHVSAYLFRATGIRISFDPSQGKFRQIRFLARRSRERKINQAPLEFSLNPSNAVPAGVTAVAPLPAEATPINAVIMRDNRVHSLANEPQLEEAQTQVGCISAQPLPKEDWSSEIAELESFFSVNLDRLPEAVHLSPAERIIDPKAFVEGHLATLRNNNGNRHFRPYLRRLQQLQSIFLSIKN